MPRCDHYARRRVVTSAVRSALLLSLGVLAPSCLVSFDGYQPLGAGHGGDAATAGAGVSGKASGGAKADRSGGGDSAGAESGSAGDVSGENGGEAGSSSSGGSSGGSSSSGTSGTSAGAPPGGSSSSGGSAGNGGSGGSEVESCPGNLEGPPLIEIPKPGGGFYCMDRTEVTNDQYAAFLASTPSTAGQDAACSWNSSFAPDTSVACASSDDARYDPMLRPKVPVGCIDWCDAKRYCAWTGKRLCGAIDGGQNAPASFADANASQWYRACTKGGTRKLPYEGEYNKSYCNGADTAGFHPATVANLPNCVGGYNGLYDMSGNVAEWEDSCSASAGANDNCLIRGGSIDSIDVIVPTLLCNSSLPDDATPTPATAKRNAKDELIGIRCCLDP